MKRATIGWLTAAAVVTASVWMWAAQQRSVASQGLAADLPPGALMTLESPDFAHLLSDWNSSAQQAAWMHSASFNVFTNSRLYGRLTDAEAEFAGAAGAEFDSQFLSQVAGKESIFAWYDIGSLEFLYITHLPPGQADKIALLGQRRQFTERKAGDTTFYVRTGSSAASENTGISQQRTVAFAQRGDWLLLATREDLLANALLLMEGHTKAPSLAEDGWYQSAMKAAPAQHGELHMLLDIDRLTRTPQFRTYWIQRNVTDTRRYRAAVVDLYREPGHFREERVLLPASADAADPETTDTAALTGLVPERAGVFRSSAAPSTAAALDELRDKVLDRATAQRDSSLYSPEADTSVDQAGDTSDLETRIDAVQPVAESADAWLLPLQHVLAETPLTAMLSISRTAPKGDALFFPIHSAIVLRRSTPWDQKQLEAAVLAALRGRLTIGVVGLNWTEQKEGSSTYLLAAGAQPIAMAVQGNTVVLSTDAALLREILARSAVNPTGKPAAASVIAEFRNQQEQAAFLRLTATLDGATSSSASQSYTPPSPQGMTAQDAAFLHGNIGSLSQVFRSLVSERFVERHDGPLLHQTVTYGWSDNSAPLHPAPAHVE